MFEKTVMYSFFIFIVLFPIFSLANNVDNMVYVGWAGVQTKELIKNINSKNRKNSLVMLNRNKKMFSISQLRWSSIKNKKQLINSSIAPRVVNVCRAKVLSAWGGEGVYYPGQFENHQCAVVSNKKILMKKSFSVLVGDASLLKWFPVAFVMNVMKNHMGVNAFKNRSQYPYGFNLMNFDFNIRLNDYMPISGGDEGGNPVLICQVRRKHSELITGKMIFLHNTLGCEVIQNHAPKIVLDHFDLLFGEIKNFSHLVG